MTKKPKYFSTAPYKSSDLTTAGNRLKAAEFRGLVHNSHLLMLVLTMAQTGKEATINMEKAAKGLPIDECIKLGEDLKQSVREKYISKILDKTLPNAHDPHENDDKDRILEYLEMVEQAEQTPAIGNGVQASGK